MIVKPYEKIATASGMRQQAGNAAERQMAHYLHRAFKDDPDAHVLNDLRLEDIEQPEQDGTAGVCQIDHLVIHRWGMFIVESKSVAEAVQVRPDGSGGDEWTRIRAGKEIGMPSPIRQAERQAQFLRAILQRHHHELVSRVPLGMRTLARLMRGSDQRTFNHVSIQLAVAISDAGRILRLDGWKAPKRPFRVFVAKADLISGKIREEIARHRRGAGLLSRESVAPTNPYGLWSIQPAEATWVARFLADRHAPRKRRHPRRKRGGNETNNRPARPVTARPEQISPPPPITREAGDGSARATVAPADHASARPTAGNRQPTCRHCAGVNLTARSGPYGYYWYCSSCHGNTPMPRECTACGTRDRGQVRVRKSGADYFADCVACGTSRKLWTQS